MIHRLTITRATLLCALAALTAAAAAPSVAAADSAHDTRFTLLRTWQPALLPPGVNTWTATYSTAMTFDPDRRVMWAVENSFPTLLAAYDSRSLTPLAPPVLLPGRVTATKLDPATGHLYVARTMVSTTTPGTDTAPHLDVYALSGATLQHLGQADLTGLGLGTDIASIYVDSPRGALYATWEADLAGAAGVGLARFTLGSSGVPLLQWTSLLPPSCPATPSVVKDAKSQYDPPALGFSEAKHAVYVLCAVPAFLVRPNLQGGVGKVTLGAADGAPAAAGGFTLFPVAGDLYSSVGSAFDAASGRLVFDTVNGSGGSEAVFDIAADRYVGLVDSGINVFTGLTVDTASGRIYGMIFGLSVADLRTTPPSQPTLYPDIRYGDRIAVDPASADIFVLGADDGDGTQLSWHVYHDTLPPLDVSSGAANPDSNTADIAENPQTTGATYSASGQGFGVVARQVGGAESAAQDAQNLFQVNGNSNPELRAAYLDGISLTADQATASSIAADRDAQTLGGTQASICAGSPAQAQPTTCPWPYRPASCSSFDTLATGADQTPTGSAASSCSLLQRSATTQASLSGVNLGEVTAASTSVSATLLEDATAGVRARVTASADNVVALGGALRIARVSTTADAHAHGRPGTANTTFSRDVEGVTLNGTALCTSPCDLDVVAGEIEAAYSGRVAISFPQPDPGFAKGSPGGYQALLRLSDGDHLDDVLNTAQPASRVEVPGMVISVVFDASRPSRTVISLAGVEAEARYGIYPLDQFLADQSAGVVPAGPPATIAATGSLLPGGDVAASPVAAPPAAAASAQAAPQPLAAIPSIFGWHGWQWALAHPGEFLRLLAVWLVFLVPVYLSARRWSLLRRHALQMDLSA